MTTMPKDWHATLVHDARSDHIYIRFKDPTWKQKGTPYRWSVLGEKEKAEALAARIEKDIKERRPFEDAAGIVTVRSFGKTFIEGRKGNTSWPDDEQRLEDYVYTAIGEMPIDEVRPKHVKAMLKALETRKSAKGGTLATRTIINTYAVCRALFNEAVIEELVRGTPCVLRGAHLPAKKDKTPGWRDTAVFSAAEIEQLVLDARIPQDRRVFYALAFLGCTRFGETAALRWQHYDSTLRPLGRLQVLRSYNTRHKLEKDTKQERPRRVPVTPLLAKILAEWKLSGWARLFGHPPEPEDLIVPSRGQGERLPTYRSANHMLKKFHKDLAALKSEKRPDGLRLRRLHDSRRTWLSTVLAAGANETHAKWIAHGPPPTVLADYTTLPWPTLCDVVDGLRRVGRLKANVP